MAPKRVQIDICGQGPKLVLNLHPALLDFACERSEMGRCTVLIIYGLLCVYFRLLQVVLLARDFCDRGVLVGNAHGLRVHLPFVRLLFVALFTLIFGAVFDPRFLHLRLQRIVLRVLRMNGNKGRDCFGGRGGVLKAAQRGLLSTLTFLLTIHLLTVFDRPLLPAAERVR